MHSTPAHFLPQARVTHRWCSLFCSEDAPQLGVLTASSVSSHNLSLSWETVSGHFDGFVIRVSDQQSDTLEFKLPAEARNITIPNLTDDTAYDIELYGISYGRHSSSVSARAVTGTAYFTCIFSVLPALG